MGPQALAWLLLSFPLLGWATSAKDMQTNLFAQGRPALVWPQTAAATQSAQVSSVVQTKTTQQARWQWPKVLGVLGVRDPGQALIYRVLLEDVNTGHKFDLISGQSWQDIYLIRADKTQVVLMQVSSGKIHKIALTSSQQPVGDLLQLRANPMPSVTSTPTKPSTTPTQPMQDEAVLVPLAPNVPEPETKTTKSLLDTLM
ncbi:hypothetical protein SAMN05421831_102179 [Allopseudospirillum japonicum]|uniref:Uncharacterized protein n=1 Tax=Allopseudospirillum japonicum TaxID=64971 RepID=A0A1H6R4U8_9GAMM|nr:hypothetical protein [Allopseudospirillum japonicum]SEI46800.1 hypothetical protein SAMN05421831_102179 [Allopseudospirillum japonicum]